MYNDSVMLTEDVFVFPISFAQQRLWLLDQLQPGDHTYNISAAVRLRGPLDTAALVMSINEVVARHESLRTTFAVAEGRPVQVVQQSLRLDVPVLRLQALPEEEREAEFQVVAAMEAQRPFELATGPLLRAVLVQMGEREHVLLLNVHHIISDGWSMGVLMGEVGALYTAFVSGEPSPLPELPIQYADFSVWQSEWLQGEVLETQLGYWRRKLEGAPPVLELPADSPRPPVRAFRSASQSLLLSAELSEAIRAFSRGKGATPFMTLLAAFKVLLGRYTGQEDIVVGSPIAGRSRAETQALIGFFLNTLVLRTDLSGEPTFGEVLERVRETTVGAYAHQDVPFEALLAELQTERDLSRTPLFQVFFNMLNLPSEAMSLPGLEVEFIRPPEVGAKFDLTLYVREPEGRFAFEAVYDADLFGPERIAELLGQLAHLLTQAVARPEQPVGSFSLITPPAAGLLPDPTRPLNADWRGPVHALFSEQARREPARVAMSDERESWTYGELEELSNRLANRLRAQGVETDDVVAIYGDRSASLVWALLGTMKAGAAFVILDPAYPTPRLAEYLKLAEPRGFIQVASAGPLPDALEEFVGALSCRCRLTLPLREEALAQGLLGEYPATAPGAEIGPDDLAYLAFTSGSTGVPKGVEGRHGPLTHFLPWMRRTFRLDAEDRFSMLSGLSHDPLHRDIFTPLTLGARVCIPSQQLIETQGRLARWMEQEGVTITNLTPAMGQLLTESAQGEGAAVVVPSLRYAFLVGDVLTRRDVARLKALAPSMTCINLYGSTETQRAVSYFEAPDADATEGHAKEILPLGKGIEDVQLLVLNKAGRQAGVGEIGEIYLRSPHVARGYLRDPALTAAKFVSNPFTGLEGDRLYRTGDLGRYLPDGNVEPLGRADFQVKVRGFRIEPGEIEAVLGGHETVREAIVIAREDAPGDRRLVAYIVPEAGATPAVAELRGFLKERLPEYMVPSAFVTLDALPLTPNRKVDRRALPAPTESQAEAGAASVEPRTPVERRLAEIWAEVLKRERVGAEDNFFELGGHSLLALRCLARVREEFKVELPLRRMFESPTVAGLAACVEEFRRTEKSRRLPPLVRAERDGGLSLSFAQQRLWFLDQLEPDSPVYNIHTALRLDGPLDADALQRTLDEIVRRHEILRTSFPVSGERPVQVIAPALDIPLQVFDVRQLPEREREAERLATEEARRPFDLSRGPLLRACLIRLDEREHVLLLVMHHIISDGWSMGVLAGEVAALYRAFVSDGPSPLKELPVQYADFAVWQREWLQGEALASQLDYWKRQLTALPLLQLPGGKAQPAAPSYRGSVHFFEVGDELTRALRALSLREGATLFMTLLAAFKALLHRHSGQTDIVVGTDTANRFPVETEGLIGFFVNQLVLRTDLSGAPSFRELLGRVQGVTLSAYEQQDVPFDRLVEALRPDRAASRTPLFQAKLVLQNSPLDPLRLPGLKLSTLDLAGGTETAKFDLLLTFVETGESLSGSLEYSTDLFDAEGVGRLARQFVEVLRQVAERPDARLGELEIFTEEEKRRDMIEERGRAESKLKKFKQVKPKALSLQQGEMVRRGHLPGTGSLPLVIEPAVDIIDLAGWVANNLRAVESDLFKYGAILFRGFKVPDQPAFAEVVKATSVPLMNYVEGATPRTQLGGKIYTSTEYPADQSIALHNELTYVTTWPMKLWFYCSQPADERGETPIADVRNVLRRISPEVRERFAAKGWMLVRNFGEGLSLPWQTSFHLDSREELESYCRGARIECVWKDGDRLQTRQVRPAIATHPTTGETVWFNHAAFWHVSSLEPQVREAMLALFGEDDLAYNTLYGDGTRIEDSVIAEIREAYRQETVEFPWQHGDVLMLDNMLVAHGRNPFAGPRKILVAMGEGFTRTDF